MRWIAKRDGPNEPFMVEKLGGSIARAAEEAGHQDPILARELASAVSLFLQHQGYGTTVSSIQLHSMTEQVLSETGYSPVAMSYTLYHQRRQRLRESLRVEDSAGRLQPWNKTRIACRLTSQQGMAGATARAIASMVEKRVMAAQFERLGCGLIRELVNNELTSWGLSPLPAEAWATVSHP